MAYCVYSYALAVRGDRADRRLRGHARGATSPSASRSPSAELARRRGRQPAATDELERAKENLKGRLLLSLESTSNRMTRLGKAIDHRHRASSRVRGDRAADRRGHGERGGGARGRAPRTREALRRPGSADESRFGTPSRRVNPALAAQRPDDVALYGADGKVGRAARAGARRGRARGRRRASRPGLTGCRRRDRLHAPGCRASRTSRRVWPQACPS